MDDIGLYKDKLHYSIDLEYLLRVVVRYKFHFIDKVFSCARLRVDSKGEGNQAEQIAHHWKISLPYMDYLSEKERVEVGFAPRKASRYQKFPSSYMAQ